MLSCPPQELWHELGRTWMLILIDALRNGDQGFNELQRNTGISSKVLSERLSTLEEYELIDKKTYEQENQERTKYLPTQKMRDLYSLLDTYKRFVKKYDDTLQCGDINCQECPYLKEHLQTQI